MPSEPRVGYVLKVYPRFSETFILNEILAHERAGVSLEIFSLRPAVDGRFHDSLARVRASVTYVGRPRRPDELWTEIKAAGRAGILHRLTSVDDEADAEEIFQALAIAHAARERNIVHLHAHFATVATRVARLAAQLAEIPHSFTAHAKDIFHEEVREDALAREITAASGVVTVSDYNAAHLRRVARGRGRVMRVYNGIDLAEYAFEPPAERPPMIAAVGRLVEKKGFPVLVEACATLAARDCSFRCVIVGSGPLEEALVDMIARQGLEDRVSLLGPRPQDEVREIVRNAAVLAAPCVVAADGNRDGLPTVLLEACALGTPVVSTPVTGIPEVVRDGETGLLVPERDPRALADALERLLEDGDERVRLARASRSHAETHFDLHRNAASLRDLFAPTRAGTEPTEGLTDAHRVPVR